jgi:hypothetical protein
MGAEFMFIGTSAASQAALYEATWQADQSWAGYFLPGIETAPPQAIGYAKSLSALRTKGLWSALYAGWYLVAPTRPPAHSTDPIAFIDRVSGYVSSQKLAAGSQIVLWLLRSHLGIGLRNESDVTSSGLHDAAGFWTNAVGVVTPHRAHKALVVSKLQTLFEPLGDDPRLIRDAVNTVERFQGQQRDVIIASYALGDPDAIADEDEFLLSLNRFNVMASRPRAKLIVLASQELINHLPGDLEVIRDSRLLNILPRRSWTTAATCGFHSWKERPPIRNRVR